MALSTLFLLSFVTLAYINATLGLKNCNSCMPYTDCKEAKRRANEERNEATMQMFRDAHCGMQGVNMVKVCCSDFINPGVTLHGRILEPLYGLGPEPDVNEEEEEEHPNMALLSDTCGKIAQDRITGGVTAKMYEFPWMVLIAYSYGGTIKFECSGTLINSLYVLTAAHCVLHKEVAGVRVGEYDLRFAIDCQGNVCEKHLQDRQVINKTIHRDYQGIRNYENDIALLRLSNPIDLKLKNADTICLPTSKALRERSISNKQVTVAGWGLTELGRESSILRKVVIPVLSDQVCKNYYGDASSPDSKQLCAGEYKKDSCRGDSGGPLMMEDEYKGHPKYVQFGIISNGPNKCGSSAPGVYTDVRKYVNWILDNIQA